jgi:DNA-binding transcriptional LysR family regulator
MCCLADAATQSYTTPQAGELDNRCICVESSPGLITDVRAPQALPYLRTFHLVATERSFTRAARALALSQPAVSAHIRALEHIYGLPLFQIRRRRAFLTPEGEALLTYTERIFNLAAEAEHAIAATHGLERGGLTFAASPTIGVYLLPPVLREFGLKYPGIHVQLSVTHSEDVVAQVLANRIPFGLVEAVVSQHQEINVRPFATDQMVLIAPPDHPWTLAGRVSRAQLRSTAVLRREPGSGLRILLDRLLEEAGLTLETAMELGTTEAIIAAVRVGVGVAWVPHITVARDAELGQLGIVEVPGVDLRRTLSVVTLQGLPLSGVAQAFLRMLPTNDSAAAPKSGRQVKSRARGGRASR